jgi:predicted O-methyltransferase YrrM
MRRRLAEAVRLERAALAVALRAALLPLGALVRRSERHLLWRLHEAGFGSRREDLYPQVRLADLMDRATPVTVVDLPADHYHVSEAELLTLAALTARLRPGVVFEIGTADGRTARNLARNLDGRGTVYTLNLPLERDAGHHQEVPVGHRFLGQPEAARITQLWGHSATFDYAPYRGRCGLVFIDADHTDAGVRADSRTALGLVDRRRGLILWHDATRYGVRTALPRLMRQEGLPVHQVAGTTLALLCFAGGRAVSPAAWAGRLGPPAAI